MLKGITVELHVRTQTGTDPFGAPEYEDVKVSVGNVLVSPSTVDDIVTSTNVNGTKELYTLAIPKEDSNVWLHREVEFFGKTWKCYSELEGIESNIPLKWNKKVLVERYG